jgi:N utilization substance protein A
MKALSPARVSQVRIDEETGTAEVIVPDYQLSLAIGKEGQNARLAARLTGWRVDIKSESQLAEEEAGYAGEEWAQGEWVTDESGEMVWRPAEGGEELSVDQWSAGDAAEPAQKSEVVGATGPQAAGATGPLAVDAAVADVVGDSAAAQVAGEAVAGDAAASPLASEEETTA